MTHFNISTSDDSQIFSLYSKGKISKLDCINELIRRYGKDKGLVVFDIFDRFRIKEVSQ